MSAAITARNVGKAYKRYRGRWSRLAEWLHLGRGPHHTANWVLRNISFAVQPGEALGIIGINGAGKSTLLKILAGITAPTTGDFSVEGRVAALLELGMGFHPEFTGRQNVMMAGQLAGHTADEIASLMPTIAAFAEIGDHLDQPLRTYSSGMQMRLAFSVATAVRPDVLIVDEALSVGDAYFQHKCFEIIRKFRDEGTTLLLVSHDKQAIQGLCSRAILLSAGSIASEGDVEPVLDFYNAMLADQPGHRIHQQKTSQGLLQTISGTGQAAVTDVVLLNSDGARVDVVNVGQSVTLKIRADIKADLDRLVLGFGIKDRLGQVIYGTNTHLTEQAQTGLRAGSRYEYTITFPAAFGPGAYSIQTSLGGGMTHVESNYEWRDLALIFNVVNRDKRHFVGSLWMEPKIEISQA